MVSQLDETWYWNCGNDYELYIGIKYCAAGRVDPIGP